MSVDKNITIKIVDMELKECEDLFNKTNTKLLFHNSNETKFCLEIKSNIDDEIYLLEVLYDNYPEYPLFLEFIEPNSRNRGTKKAYPRSKGDSFFHTMPCICNPCSRKAYSGPHKEWELIGWQQNPKIGSLKSIPAILHAIIFRINNKDKYAGRMG